MRPTLTRCEIEIFRETEQQIMNAFPDDTSRDDCCANAFVARTPFPLHLTR